MNVTELFFSSYRHQITELQNNLKLIGDESLQQAIDILMNCKGKVACTGMGKSGLIAQKLAATFSSTGTPAFFLHPGESLHGDLGALQKDDVVLCLAKSGESDEVVQMLQVVQKMGNRIISILGNAESRAGRMSDVIIMAKVSREADPLNLAPTASTTVSLVVGDALASALAELRGFKPENFALYHPAGQLGKRLLLNVEDLLVLDHGIPLVGQDASMKELLETVTKPNLGGAMITDASGKLIGIVTDGDIRRSILRFGNVLEQSIASVMTASPLRIKKGSRAIDALHMMEERKSPINVLPVVDDEDHPIGLLRLHDLVRAGL